MKGDLSKLAVKRLLQHIVFLEALPKEAKKHFEMGSFYDTKDQALPVPQSKTAMLKAGCGTTACSFGWAALNPVFKKQGLELQHYGVDYRGIANGHAAAQFFDLNMDQVNYLFFNFEVNTPKQWAAFCRQYIKENR